MGERVRKKRIQWHPAFCSAVQLVFREETISLSYQKEYLLNTKPLQADLLIIKKPAEGRLNNSLGHIFKGNNLLEYKSPEDELGIDTYYKVYAYACLYKSGGETEDAIPADDITISLVRHTKPDKLLSYFTERGFQVTQKYAGIYYVMKEGLFDTQVVVTGELEEEDQIWLRAMTPNLEQKTMERFVMKATGALNQGWRNLMDSVLEVVLAVNEDYVTERKGDEPTMCEALRRIMADEIKEALETAEKEAIKRGEAQGMERGMARGMAQGMAQGLEKGMEEGEARMGKLFSLLYETGRGEDAKRALSDLPYRKMLFEEFEL